MNYVKHTYEASDGPVRCRYITIFGVRILIAIGTGNWFTEGKPRKIPLWIDSDGLFAWRLAIKIGLKPKGSD